jgi:death on curing protein
MPNFLLRKDVLMIHDDPISSFGGTPGLRDEGLLDSALAQPQATFGQQWLHLTIPVTLTDDAAWPGAAGGAGAIE